MVVPWLGLLALALPPPVSVTVPGEAVDVVWVRGQRELLVSVAADAAGPRRLLRLDDKTLGAKGTQDVPAAAVFVDACAAGGVDRVVFADHQGIVDAAGARLLQGDGLFHVPDPTAVLVGPLCSPVPALRAELRLPTVDGLVVLTPQGPRTLLATAPARAYSGRVHRGLRPDRPYAAALSVYAPRLWDVDVDGDGDLDLVAEREGRVSVWKRGPAGLSAAPALDGDLQRLLGTSPDADLRVRFADTNGDQRIDLIVGVTEGAVPERSQAFEVTGLDGSAWKKRALWQKDGLVAPLSVRGAQLVIGEVDTSLMSLSAVVLTGRVPIRVAVGGGPALSLQAKVDVRGGRMDGALPLVAVDWNGDGRDDLLDLGEPGRAALHLATADGFSLEPAAVWTVPAFVHVVAVPALPGVVLVGKPSKGRGRERQTPLTLLRGGV